MDRHPPPTHGPSIRTPGTIDAAGTPVRTYSPTRAAVLGLLTAGVHSMAWHGAANADLARFGRRRAGMQFPFITVNSGTSITAFIFGGLGVWMFVLAALGTAASDGATLMEWMQTVSVLLLAVPLWYTARMTALRLRTARNLAGIESPSPSIELMGALAICATPLYVLHMQRALNELWSHYSTAPTTMRPADVASEMSPLQGVVAGDPPPVPAPAPMPAPTLAPIAAPMPAEPPRSTPSPGHPAPHPAETIWRAEP